MEIINNIVATKPISHSKINSVLDVHGNFVLEPKKLVILWIKIEKIK